MMATSGGSSSQPDHDLPPHGKTKVIQKFTAVDYGPLVAIFGQQCANFRGGSYQLTTPTGSGLVLYRRYGGTGEDAAKEDGQYWSAEKRDGNLSYAMDFAVLPQWNNTLENEATLFVPPGIFLFEGYASPQHHVEYGRRDYEYLGGNWQVFIPKEVVGPLLRAQRATAERNMGEIQKHVQEAMTAQQSYMEKYDRIVKEKSEKQLNEFCTPQNAQRLLKNGNAVGGLSQSVKKALLSESTAVSSSSGSQSETMPTGTYLVHRETIRLFNGANISVSLHVRIEFSHETKRVYQSGNTTVTEITRHYKRIFEWA